MAYILELKTLKIKAFNVKNLRFEQKQVYNKNKIKISIEFKKKVFWEIFKKACTRLKGLDQIICVSNTKSSDIKYFIRNTIQL